MKKFCCPVTGVYLPRFIPSVVAGLIFIYAFNFVLNAKFLMSTYELTPQLWRTPEDMKAHFNFILLTQFLTAFVTALIYTKNHEGKGVGEGIRYGLMIGALMGILMAAPYAWTPVSFNLAEAWFVGGLLEGVGLGVIYSLLYNKGKGCCGNASCGKGECKCSKGGCGDKEKGACGTGS